MGEILIFRRSCSFILVHAYAHQLCQKTNCYPLCCCSGPQLLGIVLPRTERRWQVIHQTVPHILLLFFRLNLFLFHHFILFLIVLRKNVNNLCDLNWPCFLFNYLPPHFFTIFLFCLFSLASRHRMSIWKWPCFTSICLQSACSHIR